MTRSSISWVSTHLPQWLPASWIQRAANEPWAYLLDPPKILGSLICVTRGKLLVLAAGNVSELLIDVEAAPYLGSARSLH